MRATQRVVTLKGLIPAFREWVFLRPADFGVCRAKFASFAVPYPKCLQKHLQNWNNYRCKWWHCGTAYRIRMRHEFYFLDYSVIFQKVVVVRDSWIRSSRENFVMAVSSVIGIRVASMNSYEHMKRVYRIFPELSVSEIGACDLCTAIFSRAINVRIYSLARKI